MKQKLIRLVTGALMASFFVAACAPAATAVPTATGTTATGSVLGRAPATHRFMTPAGP